jgi:hypothetical protein
LNAGEGGHGNGQLSPGTRRRAGGVGGGRKRAMAAIKRGYGAFLPLFVRAGVGKTTQRCSNGRTTVEKR